MTRWVRAHPYTILAAVLLATFIAWNAAYPLPWWQYLMAGLTGMTVLASGYADRARRRRHRASPLPCPPGCPIRAAHFHERISR